MSLTGASRHTLHHNRHHATTPVTTHRYFAYIPGEFKPIPSGHNTIQPQKPPQLRFSPDGKRIISGSYDKTLRLWDVATGQPIGASLTGHTGAVLSVAFSRDGKRIVSGSDDKTLRLWDVATGQPIGAPLTGHTDLVYTVAFGPDGRWIVSSGVDNTLRVWDADSGQPIGPPLTGHTSFVYSVAFSPDGERIVSGSSDFTVRVWPAPTLWPALLCAKLTTNMSDRQWREWVSPDIGYIKVCPDLPNRARLGSSSIGRRLGIDESQNLVSEPP